MSYPQNMDLFLKTVCNGRLDLMKKFVSTFGFESTAEKARSHGENGETALLVAIAHSHMQTFDFLIQELEAPVGQTGRFIWNGKEYSDITPLLAAITSNQHIFVEYLTAIESPAFMISIMFSSLPRLQKIEALELVGSAYVFYGYRQAFRFGIPCLKQALVLRQPTVDGQSAIPKIIHPLSDHIRQAIGNISEITTLEQLKQVEGDYHRLFVEAFIISQRILNRPVFDPYLYFLPFLFQYVVKCLTDSQYDRSISISLLVLESFKPCQWKTLRTDIRNLIVNTCNAMSESFRMLFQSTEDVNKLMTFTNVMIALNFGFAHFTQILSDYAEDRTSPYLIPHGIIRFETYYVFDLILLACEMLPTSSQLQSVQFKRNLARFIQLVEKSGSFVCHPLHKACEQPVVPINLIELLIAVGADPNVVDSKNDTPLHLLAQKNWNSVHKAVELLINSGACLDRVNEYDCSALKLFQLNEECIPRQDETNVSQKLLQLKEEYINWQKKKRLIVLPLTHHCAKAILKYQIPFERKLPSCLYDKVVDAMVGR